MINKIVFFSLTPPLKRKGSGLSVLLYNIIFSLDNFERSIVTFCSDTNLSSSEIQQENQPVEVLVCDSWMRKLYRIKYVRFFKELISSISFIIIFLRIGKLVNSKNTFVILSVGTSAKPIWKYNLLKAFFRRPKYGIYIVDDLELINKKLQNKVENFFINFFLPAAIRHTDYLITISEGLSKVYLNKYNKDSLVLQPHFSAVKPLNQEPLKKEFVFLFTGGLNFLYNESLLTFASVLDEINKQKKFEMRLKLKIQTYSHISEYNRLGFDPLTVEYSTVVNRNELTSVYESCNCFLIPYSFNVSDIQIVSTSFPQKLAEIIQYGKQILCFAPDYSSVTQFFNKHNLKYVCSANDRIVLMNIIADIVVEYSNFSFDDYVEAYSKALSKDMVNKIFQNIAI